MYPQRYQNTILLPLEFTTSTSVSAIVIVIVTINPFPIVIVIINFPQGKKEVVPTLLVILSTIVKFFIRQLIKWTQRKKNERLFHHKGERRKYIDTAVNTVPVWQGNYGKRVEVAAKSTKFGSLSTSENKALFQQCASFNISLMKYDMNSHFKLLLPVFELCSSLFFGFFSLFVQIVQWHLTVQRIRRISLLW